MDLHKWLHIPFEAGVALVRSDARSTATPSRSRRSTWRTPSAGMAAGGHWFSEYGLQLSRGFKALKVWLSIKEQGIAIYGRLIDQNIAQAHYLAGLVRAQPRLEMMAPVELNIVCFRQPWRPGAGGAERAEQELLIRLHESGVAAPSYTTLDGCYCLRVAIANHRSVDEDFAALVAAVVEIGGEVRQSGSVVELASNFFALL